MNQSQSDLRTALLCVSFILAAGLGALLFNSPQEKPLMASHSAQGGLEIFTLAK